MSQKFNHHWVYIIKRIIQMISMIKNNENHDLLSNFMIYD